MDTKSISGTDDLVQMAILAEVCSRPRDMRLYIKRFIESVDDDLKDWQRDLFSISYKAAVMEMRKAIKILQHTFTYEKDDEKVTEDYEEKLFNELLEVVYEVVHLIDGKLLDADGGGSSDGGDDSFVKSPESRAFYIKMKADYYRYVAEVAHGDSKRQFALKSQAAYQQAMRVLDASDQPLTVIHVGLTLNYSVFLYEVLADVASACEMAQEALEKAVICCKSTEDYEANSYLEELIMLLSENVKIWSGKNRLQQERHEQQQQQKEEQQQKKQQQREEQAAV